MNIMIPKTVQGVEITLIDRGTAIDLIDDLDTEEIVRKAYAGYVPGMCSGLAEFDLITEQLITNSLGQNEYNQPLDSQVIVLYQINQDYEFRDEDLLDSDELADREDGETVEGYCDRVDINITEREIESLYEYYADDRNSEQDTENILEQCDRIYSKAEQSA